MDKISISAEPILRDLLHLKYLGCSNILYNIFKNRPINSIPIAACIPIVVRKSTESLIKEAIPSISLVKNNKGTKRNNKIATIVPIIPLQKFVTIVHVWLS